MHDVVSASSEKKIQIADYLRNNTPAKEYQINRILHLNGGK